MSKLFKASRARVATLTYQKSFVADMIQNAIKQGETRAIFAVALAPETISDLKKLGYVCGMSMPHNGDTIIDWSNNAET